MGFSNKLISWYEQNGRDLPWRKTNDPYVIWLSEIILQQTRVEQGTPYFYRFLEAFPTLHDFANADEGEILRLWQGLGYYSRARNMHRASKQILNNHKGIFPTEYGQLINLAGIGEYTASAIASFSTNARHAVLDGNVFRVLSRYFGVHTPINSSQGKKEFAMLANEIIDLSYPGRYNQAIMDFGALQCKPKNPDCGQCIFSVSCWAYQHQQVGALPIKIKKKQSRDRYFHYFILKHEDQVLMSQRSENDIWANLYEFPLIETPADIAVPELLEDPQFIEYFAGSSIIQVGNVVKQVLSHQNIYAKFYEVLEPEKLVNKKANWNYFNSEKIDRLAKHKLIVSFLRLYKNTL